MTHPGQRVDEGAVRGRGEVGVGLQRAVEVDGGGDADADAFAADGVADGLCHFDDEAGTGLGGTAVQCAWGAEGQARRRTATTVSVTVAV
nr:hypothetical protein [Streptomyces hygroscopicus]